MFELSFIKKYLYPGFRKLSVSVVSLVSVVTVTLVVWLILVFLSVTNGMEKNWTERLTALSSPLQILPTEAYYDSFYYRSDALSEKADYTYKSIAEKRIAPFSYDPLSDEPPSELSSTDVFVDPVKEVFASLDTLGPGVRSEDFELSLANVRFRLLRSLNTADLGQQANAQSFLSQIAYLTSFDPSNEDLRKTILPPSMRDLTNIFSLLASSGEDIQKDGPDYDPLLKTETFHEKLRLFLRHASISHLKTGEFGYYFPRRFLPKEGSLTALLFPDSVLEISEEKSFREKQKKDPSLKTVRIDLATDLAEVDGRKEPLKNFHLRLKKDILLPILPMTSSLKEVFYPGRLSFCIKTKIQQIPLEGEVPFQNLEIGKVVLKEPADPVSFPLWSFPGKECHLPHDPDVGEGVLLPKSFRENGVLCGDRGYISYHAQTASAFREMRLPVFVAGFYDPGLIPNGGKIIIAPKKMISSINASVNIKDPMIGNGIGVRFKDLHRADHIKEHLLREFTKRGIDSFWEIKTYKEYDYAKDFIEQVSSDKVIFSLIAVLMILVACTNIISMLILLVNDKKKEIGILEAMGCSKKSIIAIFGGCGLAIGLLSAGAGSLMAYFTLKNIGTLMKWFSRLQGHTAFNPAFFGDTLPDCLNGDAFRFVWAATLIMSLLAGWIPAYKAGRLRTSDILKTDR